MSSHCFVLLLYQIDFTLNVAFQNFSFLYSYSLPFPGVVLAFSLHKTSHLIRDYIFQLQQKSFFQYLIIIVIIFSSFFFFGFCASINFVSLFYAANWSSKDSFFALL